MNNLWVYLIKEIRVLMFIFQVSQKLCFMMHNYEFVSIIKNITIKNTVFTILVLFSAPSFYPVCKFQKAYVSFYVASCNLFLSNVP